jgi:hypothetical protein
MKQKEEIIKKSTQICYHSKIEVLTSNLVTIIVND